MLVKAEKGETLVLLPRINYEEKMKDLLRAAGATISTASFNDYNRDIRERINGPSHIIDCDPKLLLQMHASFPQLYDYQTTQGKSFDEAGSCSLLGPKLQIGQALQKLVLVNFGLRTNLQD